MPSGRGSLTEPAFPRKNGRHPVMWASTVESAPILGWEAQCGENAPWVALVVSSVRSVVRCEPVGGWSALVGIVGMGAAGTRRLR